jgi:hypothetical protein
MEFDDCFATIDLYLKEVNSNEVWLEGNNEAYLVNMWETLVWTGSGAYDELRFTESSIWVNDLGVSTGLPAKEYLKHSMSNVGNG